MILDYKTENLTIKSRISNLLSIRI
uniref:Uncharacterized protein n=1 Tax=Rhizophora mucronata TaxID=61149 RepID=A0A2P2PKN0_RHIMU